MEELIKQALDKYFSDFKQYHLIILIGFLVTVGLLQLVQAILISRKIETFKTDLKRTEIKFSRFNELQINALRKIYHLLVQFQVSNNSLFKYKPKSIEHSKYRNRINDWIKTYMECANEFALEKILLTEEIKSLFTRTLNDFEEVKDILINEKESLDYHEMVNQADWNAMYDYEDNELDIISTKIQKIKANESIINSDRHIRELRERIEKVFSEMN